MAIDLRHALVGLLALMPALAAAVVISGEVYSVGSQVILTPPSNSAPVVLRTFAPEGSRVKAGDVVLRIDGASAVSSIREFQSQHTLARSRADKEVAELAVKAIDAERALRNAENLLAKATIDAGIPRAHVSALDFDRYAGELTRTTRELAVKQAEWEAAKTAVERRRQDATLELGQLQAQIDFAQTELSAAEVHAKRDGIVVHGFDPWRGNRFDEGASSYPGQRVGEIVDDGGGLKLAVRAWALDVDRPGMSVGQAVGVAFDALGGSGVQAHIARIGGAPQAKAEWGEGRYFEIELEAAIPPALQAVLRPGSSVRVSTELANTVGGVASTRPPRRMDGEIVALEFSAIAPPVIGEQWMLTLTQLVPDGTQVTAGQVVAGFDGNEVSRKLNEKSSSLNEKRTQLERLQLELGERQRAEAIATAEQRAKLTKAERKAAQPEALIAAMEYKKLTADKVLAQSEMDILVRRERLAAQQRAAEREQIEAEVQMLQAQVDELQAGLGALNVQAQRAGVMLHLSNFQGEKFDVGSQVFRGQSVAQIPDLAKLAVRMQVPERDIGALRIGQGARVDVEGGTIPTLTGTVTEIGRVVRSRSRVKPVPVVDVNVQLEALPEGATLKPGQPVRVELLPGAGATVAGSGP
jgi:multidrug resistance efflux pump